MLKIKCFIFNPVAENTYIVWDDESLECAVIDAGCYSTEEKKELQEYIERENLKVKYLLATHLHFDHVFGNTFVSDTFGVGLSAHHDDEFMLDRFSERTALFGLQTADTPAPVSRHLTEKDILSVGRYDFSIIHVPGHSPGSLIFYCAKAGVAISGDVLFQNSIGRTDLWGGNYEVLVSSIQKKLFILPDSTVIYPGHGPSTTIGHEKTHNPYLK